MAKIPVKIRKLKPVEGSIYFTLAEDDYDGPAVYCGTLIEEEQQMKHTPEEIIKALQVIQDECKAYNDDCLGCPFYTTADECKFVTGAEPIHWHFNRIDWRAFLDF